MLASRVRFTLQAESPPWHDLCLAAICLDSVDTGGYMADKRSIRRLSLYLQHHLRVGADSEEYLRKFLDSADVEQPDKERIGKALSRLANRSELDDRKPPPELQA